VLDEANLVYELEKSKEDILVQLGPKHTFSIECPYGTDDERAVGYALARYAATRNRMPDAFVDELHRGSRRNPTESVKPYVQWQRGPLTRTTMAEMKSWADTTAGDDNIWLVLVFHGVDGVGWEAKPGTEIREYLEYVQAQRAQDRLWVATFQDVAKYLRERMHAQVQAAREGDTIRVTLTHSLDKGLYDLPLTLQTEVPADWSNVAVQQGERVQQIGVLRENNRSYVQYRAVPNADTVTLARGGR
jgi:hypothetical protein